MRKKKGVSAEVPGTVEDYDTVWAALAEDRLHEGSSPQGRKLLGLLAETPRRLSVSKVYDIDLRFCSTLKDTTLIFAEALSLPNWFGANGDALHDVLTDLPSGRYVFKLRGTRRLDKTVLLNLKMVLAAQRVGGTGYRDGSAVFLIE